jgi:hypothetical protein
MFLRNIDEPRPDYSTSRATPNPGKSSCFRYCFLNNMLFKFCCNFLQELLSNTIFVFLNMPPYKCCPIFSRDFIIRKFYENLQCQSTHPEFDPLRRSVNNSVHVTYEKMKPRWRRDEGLLAEQVKQGEGVRAETCACVHAEQSRRESWCAGN